MSQVRLLSSALFWYHPAPMIWAGFILGLLVGLGVTHAWNWYDWKYREPKRLVVAERKRERLEQRVERSQMTKRQLEAVEAEVEVA